jgi:hypothetical protein
VTHADPKADLQTALVRALLCTSSVTHEEPTTSSRTANQRSQAPQVAFVTPAINPPLNE